MQQFSTIGIISRRDNRDIIDSLQVLTAFLQKRPHTGIVVPPDVFEKLYRNWNPGMVGVQA